MSSGAQQPFDSKPLVSLCVPTFKRARFIEAALKSALRQSYSNLEVIVVDDASPDNTEAVVRGICDTRLRYYRNEINLGVPSNYNRAFSLAKGKYVSHLGDHDLLHPDYVAESVSLLEAKPEAAFVATGLTTIGQDDEPRETYLESLPRLMPGHELLRRLLRRTTCPFPMTAMVRRSLLLKFETVFDPKYGWYADIDLWMRLLTLGDFGYINKPLLLMRRREEDHPLNEQVWETWLRLDAINRGNWHRLHPKPGASHALDSFLYDLAKAWAVIRFRVQLAFFKRRSWTSQDDDYAGRYLSPMGVGLARAARLIPESALTILAAIYLKHWRRRHLPGPC